MGTTRFHKAKEVLEEYMKKSGKDYIHTQTLRALILREIGGDENRTVVPTLKMLRELGIITEKELHKWKITIT